MTLYFVNRFYAPDISATSQLLTDLTINLSEDFDVVVLTSRYEMKPGKALKAQETLLGVRVTRLHSTSFGKSRLWKKALDLLSFHLAVAWLLLRKVKVNDVVVLKTDPPMLQLINTSIVRFKKGKVVNWLQDLYPEVAIRLGVYPDIVWLKDFMLAWRDRACKKAHANIVISQSMSAYLASRQITNVQVISNWADHPVNEPQPRENNPLRAEWGLEDKFVVMYSGNFGRVHEFREIVEAIRLLHGQQLITFLFVGEGAELNSVKAQLTGDLGENVVFKPFQPPEKLALSLGVADIHLVSLKNGMEDLVMPSKVYGILAAARPLVFIGESDSCLAKEISRRGVGMSITYGEGRTLATELERLSVQPKLMQDMGKRASQWFREEFTLNYAVNQWKEVLVTVSALN